jgi:hypothetical protein
MRIDPRLARLFLSTAAVLLTPPGQAVEAPSDTAQAAHQVAGEEGLRARMLRDEPSPVRELDPAIFTPLSPVTASDPALRLPEDQQDDS